MYSFWSANALWEYYKVTRSQVVRELLPSLIENYQIWEKGWMRHGHFIGRNPDGLFSTYDDRDGMEMQIGGSGKRPTINSYMYGDLLISGLMGIRPQSESTLVVHPLIPSHAWDWFCLDGVSYQGHVLTILYDRTGTHYQQGKGFIIFVDGKMKWHSKDIQKVQIDL